MSRLPAVLAALAALTGAPAAAAQTIPVRTLALREGNLPELFLRGPQEHHPLRFSANQPGDTVRALKADPLPLYRNELDPKGNQVFVVAHQVKVPPGANGLLLLGWTVGDQARCVAIKDDFAAARFNDWLLINASSLPVAFKVGRDAKAVVVAAGGSATCRITAPRGQGAEVLAQAPIDGEPKLFFSTYWPVHADKRTVVLFADDGPGRIHVRRISDALAAAQPETTDP